MTRPVQLQKLLFDALSGIDRPEDREMFLEHTCRNDPELCRRLERMYERRQQAEEFFKRDTRPDAPEGGTEAGATTEEVGARIGAYRLLARIGEGGCGVVYLAEQQEPVRRRVALKIIRLGMDTETVIARFKQERQALAMMDHPNIARVFDVGATRSGRPYFVMQLVDGEPITSYCEARRIDIPGRLNLFIRVCLAIQHAHQKGVIHRDIKPSNILVAENDGEAVPKVIDFGIAKATSGGIDGTSTFTAAGQFVGTPAYMSPEQAAGQGMDVDTRSDIFSLGALLYELLCGCPPIDPEKFRNAGPDDVRRILAGTESRLPSLVAASPGPRESGSGPAARRRRAAQLRGDLDRIVMKAMAKDRKFRYPTAEAMAADLTRHLNNEPVLARAPSRLYRFGKLVRRNWPVFAAAAAVLGFLLLALGISLSLYHQANLARDAAEHARSSEAALRKQAEIGENIARAAVLLKYQKVSEADALLAGIPPELAQPSLESAGIFHTLALWHAHADRWHDASNRFAALAYSITGADNADSEIISLNLLPAAAAMCEAGNRTGYENLRAMAVERFGGTSNPIVAEQVIKACLILPASPDFMAKLAPLESLLLAAHTNSVARNGHALHLALWREFALALMAYRSDNLDTARDRATRCLASRNQNQARDALALSVRAICHVRQGQFQEARRDRDDANAIVAPRFTTPDGIFAQMEPHWQDWIIARLLLREADALPGW